jgi:CBS domain-containing protein
VSFDLVVSGEERVSSIMTKDVIHTIGPNVSIEEAARRMKQVQRGCLIVVDKGEPVGIITERDFVQKVIAERLEPKETLVAQVMSYPIVSVEPNALLTDAAIIMSKNKIRRLPVIEDTELVGILTVTDFAKHLLPKSLSDPMLRAMARANELFSPSFPLQDLLEGHSRSL